MCQSFALITAMLCLLTFVSHGEEESTRVVNITSLVNGRISGVPRDVLKKHPIRVTLFPRRDLTTYVQADGSFVFFEVPPGSYLLDLSSEPHLYTTYRVDVSRKEKNRIRVSIHDGTKTLISSTQGQFVVEPMGPAQYYIPREPLNPWAILRNPMVLMMVFGCGMTYLMPMLASEEELKRSMKEMQDNVKAAQQIRK